MTRGSAAAAPRGLLWPRTRPYRSHPHVPVQRHQHHRDTYTVDTPGQPIDVTRVPNGTYALKIEANPAGRLREVTRADDVALRTIVLAGRPGRRTVSAPPADGVDTEGWARRGRPLR